MMDTVFAPLALFTMFTGAVTYIFTPFFSHPVMVPHEDATAASMTLELEKVNLMKQLREAEFEQEMGLLGEEDFSRTRAELMAEVGTVMSAIDAAGGKTAESVVPDVAAAVIACPQCQTESSADDRFCSQCGAEIAGGCPHCGQTVLPDDRFCGHCGRGLIG